MILALKTYTFIHVGHSNGGSESRAEEVFQ
jgi:hypothetical protein